MLNRHYVRAAYLVGAALILIPMFDAGTSLIPLRLGESHWRYGMLGLLSNSLLIPLAGVALVFGIALSQGDRRTVRVLGVIAGLSFLLTVAALLTFALDALQSQGGVRPDLRLPYIVASSTAAVKLIIGAIAFALFALAGLKRAPHEVSRAPKREPLLVGEMQGRIPRKSEAPT